MDIRKAKEFLRQSISERLSHMTSYELAAESRSLCRRILENLPPPPLTVCGYYPLKAEADIRPLLEELLRRGDTVYLPVFKRGVSPSPSSPPSREGYLTFRACSNLSDLRHGTFDILEPPESSAEPDPMSLNLALIPGRAFDREGMRLGRGNGGYDKWIAKQRQENPSTKFWGIAFECQIVNGVPHEDHDQKMDRVVTARGITHC